MMPFGAGRRMHVPRVCGGDAPRRVLGGEDGARVPVAAGGGGRGRRHGGDGGEFHHRHEAPASSSRRATELNN